ncbi:hypothetical protein [Marinobacter salarius]|uniref:hypothetical protein n=1 Tax=Marinobacter salarius TaxID=1420917 RepID=UPI0032EE4840
MPGFVFQGIVIGGGYATGRELAEFFLPNGPIGGLLGLGVTALIWGAVMAVSFELCRMSGSYDYRHFFQRLLGRGWFVYEILLVLLMIVVLSVVAAASGEIANNIIGFSPYVGTGILLLAIGVLVFFGSSLIERFMGFWSLLLYGCYITLVIWSLISFGPEIKETFSRAPMDGNWFMDGVRYAGYNVALVPMVFFCLNHIQRRQVAITAGLIAGVIGVLPAVFLYIAMMSIPDQMAKALIPSALLLERLDARWFEVLFQLVLLGTLVQTGVGMIHGVNERIATTLKDSGKDMPPLIRPVVASLLLLTALLAADVFGLIHLIAKGYGMLTFGFIAVFVLPVLTLGLSRVYRSTGEDIHAPQLRKP